MTYLHLTHYVVHALLVNRELYHVINVQEKSVFHVTTFDQKKKKEQKQMVGNCKRYPVRSEGKKKYIKGQDFKML